MYRVIKRFNDRYTGERYEVGAEYKPDGKEAAGRVDHLIARGFLEEARSARAGGQAGTAPESAPVRARADAVEDDDECAPDSSTDE